jgi:hypothetical protein
MRGEQGCSQGVREALESLTASADVARSCSANLEEFRVAVSDALRNCGYDIDWMERYAARDDRPRAACEMDVAKSDYYVGIFAWRYGHVPEDSNPEGRSVTELEYLAAGAAACSSMRRPNGPKA